MSNTDAAETSPKPDEIDLSNPRFFVNRELSMLEFQRRVLEEAKDENNPLLERVKFLAILGSNLDEFFMVRVASLRNQLDAGVVETPPDGLTPAEQLAAIRKVALQLSKEGHECLRDELLPMLNQAGIHILDYEQLNERQMAFADQYFEQVVYPVLTPLAFDPGHPFPHISNLSLNLAVVIRSEGTAADAHKEFFARLKVPDTLPRLVEIKPSSGSHRRDGAAPRRHYFVWLEQVIMANLEILFPGMEVVEAYPFRVTRDADTAIQEIEASDLLETIDQAIRQRKFGSVVRMSVNPEMPTRIREILAANMELDRRDIYTMDGPLGLSALMAIRQIDRPDLKDPPYKPSRPIRLRGESRNGDIFSAIRRQDILLQHPYDSFNPVVDFLNQAARDPDVLAIKMTLYRVGRNSPVVQALLDARERDKQVAVLVELKARFDEESNITWARTLESAGVHVIYGLLGLKTHSKIALVVRKEGETIRRYVHLATGNYNAVTALLYEDLGMFTADEEIGADATDLFNYLTGYSAKNDYHKLLVAPVNLRQGIMDLIEGEIEQQEKGQLGQIIFKINHLVDPLIIQALYRASMAGVKVDLVVRGICCLRPGLPKISENIRVISVVGRFLEHSRIYYARHGGNEKIFLGSADMMPRNINRRVEVLFPVQDLELIRHLRDDILETYRSDNVKGRLMQPDGTYTRIVAKENEPAINSQSWLLNYHLGARRKSEEKRLLDE